MENHSCLTYLNIVIDSVSNVDCKGLSYADTERKHGETISAKRAAETALRELTDDLAHTSCGFTIGRNTRYDVDVNEMLRVTLKDLFGKEERLRAIIAEHGLSVYLVIVPNIVAQSDEPKQMLSLENDIIEFLYKSGAMLDLDYYVV